MERLEKLEFRQYENWTRSPQLSIPTLNRLDNLHALNFMLYGALGGGGTVSLLVDNQGKTLSQGLLNMEIEVSEDLLA